MLAMPETVKEHVRKGEISATTARHLAKSDLTPAEQDALIQANLEENARITGKRKKVTPKGIKREQAKATPAPQEQEGSHVEPQSLPAPAEAAPDVPAPAQAALAAPHQPLPGLSENRVEPDAGDPGGGQAVVSLAQPPNDNGMKAVADALLPFARYSELNDLDERDDDDAIEIPIRDVKRAAAAWYKLTGQSSAGDASLAFDDRSEAA